VTSGARGPAAPGNPSGGGSSDPGSRAGDANAQKRRAAEAAAALVEDGMRLGLGTGSTVAHLFGPLAARGLRLVCVATSPATADVAIAAGLDVRPFEGIDRLDLAIDGADQVADDGWLVKGGGGAHTREKIVAAAAERFVVIVSADKPVPRLAPPVPLELAVFGLAATLRHLDGIGRVARRQAPPTPDGGVLADLWPESFDPAGLATALDAVPGLVAHGLFPPELTSEVLVGGPDGVARRPAVVA
jgi:ribose 5-phosphate isomerase A